MAANISKVYTTTGAQNAVDIDASHGVTYGITSENGDVTIASVEVKIGKDGRWYDSTPDSMIEGEAYTLFGPIEAMRVNVSSLGTSTFYYFDITASDR